MCFLCKECCIPECMFFFLNYVLFFYLPLLLVKKSWCGMLMEICEAYSVYIRYVYIYVFIISHWPIQPSWLVRAVKACFFLTSGAAKLLSRRQLALLEELERVDQPLVERALVSPPHAGVGHGGGQHVCSCFFVCCASELGYGMRKNINIYIYIHSRLIIYPIGSMYGIFTQIWLIFIVNVGIFTIHGSYGYYIFFNIYIKRLF